MSQALEDIKERAVRLAKKRIQEHKDLFEEELADRQAAATRKRAAEAPEAEVVEAPSETPKAPAASKSKAA